MMVGGNTLSLAGGIACLKLLMSVGQLVETLILLPCLKNTRP